MKRDLMQIRWPLIAVLFWVFTTASAQETFTEVLSQVSFPKKLALQYQDSTHTLVATGASAKKRLRRDKQHSGSAADEQRSICTVAHYMESPPQGEAQKIYGLIWESKGAKIFVININLSIPAGKIKDWFLLQAKMAEPVGSKQVQKSLQEFANLFAGAFQADERCQIQWRFDGTTLVVMPDGTEKTIADPGLAPFWWKLWLGEKSPFDRADLVNRIITL